MPKRLLFIVTYSLFIGFRGFVWANGGPVDMGHLRKTGNIRLLHNADVTLLREDLAIQVVGDSTFVAVTYRLRNNGPAQQIHYGFPVDAYEGGWSYGESAWPVFEGGNTIVGQFQITSGAEPCKLATWVESAGYRAQSIDLGEGFQPKGDHAILRKWYTTALQFEQGEVKELHVNYRLKNTLRDKSPGFGFVHRFSHRHFTYDLAPSGNWGDGIVQEFHLRIDLRAIVGRGGEPSIAGIEATDQGNGIFVFDRDNYDLRLKDRLEIHYNLAHVALAAFIAAHPLPNTAVQSIRCSSNPAQAQHLIDGSPTTSWTGREGDWIEIQFRNVPRAGGQGNMQLQTILALNGDYTDTLHFAQSGKLTSLKVTLNDTLLYNAEPWKWEEGSRIVHLDPPKFGATDPTEIPGRATVLADGYGLHGSRKIALAQVTKVRITLLRVDGTQGNQVTLSELYFLGR